MGRSGSMKAEFSKWDSDLFGYKVGILKCKEEPIIHEIKRDNQDLDVVFVKADNWVYPHENVEALDYLYDMDLNLPVLEWEEGCQVERLEKPLDSHLKLSKAAFVDSRFLRDQRLADKAPALYESWLHNGGGLYTLPFPEKNIAFVLVSKDGPGIRRISLVAVDESCRGLGSGARLLKGVMELFEREYIAWRVKVSARNIGAIRFYEGLGFRVKKVMTAFHVWLKEQETGK